MAKEKEILKLEKIRAYAVVASDDDRSASTRGYYRDSATALNACVGVGWYGSNGDVSAVELYTDGKFIYQVKNLGMFTDEEKKHKEDMEKAIKSKLTPEEQEFLKIK